VVGIDQGVVMGAPLGWESTRPVFCSLVIPIFPFSSRALPTMADAVLLDI